MEGDFSSKGAIKMGAVKSLQTGSHINKKVPASFAQSSLPIETFLHVQTGRAKYPRTDQIYALHFHVSCAGVTGFAFSLSTLHQHCWNTNLGWISDVAQTDLHALKRTGTLWAMSLDWTQLPEKRDPSYRHPPLEGQTCDKIQTNAPDYFGRGLSRCQ